MHPETRRLCDELLGMAEQEIAALGAGNLGDLERCLARKASILEELTGIGLGKGETGFLAGELSEILERVRYAHNQVRDGVLGMLEACEEALVDIGRGRKAHRAYQRGRMSGAAPKGRKPGSRRGGSRERSHVL